MPEFTFYNVIMRMIAGTLPLILGIVLPAIVQVWIARRCGDSTAADMGRLSLNPLKHLTYISLIPFICTSIISSFLLSWGRPISINSQNFRHPNRDTILVALSNLLTNLLLAFIFIVFFILFSTQLPTTYRQPPNFTEFNYFEAMLYAGIRINFALAWFSLLPIPPLSGSKIISIFLPNKMKISYLKLERYAFPILPILMMTGILSFILLPFINMSMNIAVSILML